MHKSVCVCVYAQNKMRESKVPWTQRGTGKSSLISLEEKTKSFNETLPSMSVKTKQTYEADWITEQFFVCGLLSLLSL